MIQYAVAQNAQHFFSSRTFTHLLQTIWQLYCRFQTKHGNTIVFPYFMLSLLFILTFRGPWIVIYSSNKNQRDALFLKFILIKNSIWFGQICCPISAVSTLYTRQKVTVMLVMFVAREVRTEMTSLADSQLNERNKHLLLCIQCRDSWWWTVDVWNM